MYMPTEDVKEIWPKLTAKEQEWYMRFCKAVDYGNMEILQELCDEAPSDQFERLKAEITYERDAHKRAQYTLPKTRKPRYTEWDYAWNQPHRYPIKEQIRKDYFGDRESPEMYSPRATA